VSRAYGGSRGREISEMFFCILRIVVWFLNQNNLKKYWCVLKALAILLVKEEILYEAK
jgi:hypothetical protein